MTLFGLLTATALGSGPGLGLYSNATTTTQQETNRNARRRASARPGVGAKSPSVLGDPRSYGRLHRIAPRPNRIGALNDRA
jgi:hypothetical protein